MALVLDLGADRAELGAEVVSPNRFIISFGSHFDIWLVALQTSLNDFEQFISQK
jgi:hypothetical protein